MDDSMDQTPQGQGSYLPTTPSTNPLARIVAGLTGTKAVSYGDPQSTTNFAPALSAMETKLGLPSGSLTGVSQQTQGGKPFVSSQNFKDIEPLISHLTTAQSTAEMHKMMMGQKNPTLSPELTSALASGDTDQVSQQWQKENPGVPMPSVLFDKALNAQKATATGKMADARSQMVDVMNKRLLGMFEGPQALQQGMQDASGRVNNINRFYGVYKTIQDSDFQATPVQRNLLNTEVARVITGSGGVMTDDSFNRIASNTAAQKIGNWQQWLTNEATPTQFKSFADQSKQLMDNEYGINQQIFQAGQKMSAHILGTGQPAPYQAPPSIPGVQTPPPPNINNDPENNALILKMRANKIKVTPRNIEWAKTNLK